MALRSGDWTVLKALAATTTWTETQRLSLREKEHPLSLGAEHGDHERTAQWFETVLSESEQRQCVKAQRLARNAYDATGRLQKGLAVRLAKMEFLGA